MFYSVRSPMSNAPSSIARRRFLKDLVLTTAFGVNLEALSKNLIYASSDCTLTFDSIIERPSDSYTQGLAFEIDPQSSLPVLYESGGRYGKSLLRCVNAKTYEIIRERKIPRNFFAEGISIIGDKIYLLTWREHTCLIYDKFTFQKVAEFSYTGEGWGLAYDGQKFLMSNGSSKIKILDPATFRVQKTIDVHYKTSKGYSRIQNLNELEYINGEIWANIFQQDLVVRINPLTGEVIGKPLNFTNYVPKKFIQSNEYVLNGLAFDPDEKKLYLTGKCWPVIYVFKLS